MIAKNPSPRDRVAELVIAVACAAGAWWMIAKPFHDRAATAQLVARDTQSQLDQASVARAENPERAAAIMGTVFKWSTAHADPLLVGGLLQKAADDGEVHIDRLTPTDDEATNAYGPLALTSRRFELITTGSARSIIGFLDAVDNLPLMVVNSFELAPGSDGGAVVALIHIEVTRIALADAATNGASR